MEEKSFTNKARFFISQHCKFLYKKSQRWGWDKNFSSTRSGFLILSYLIFNDLLNFDKKYNAILGKITGILSARYKFESQSIPITFYFYRFSYKYRALQKLTTNKIILNKYQFKFLSHFHNDFVITDGKHNLWMFSKQFDSVPICSNLLN